MKKLILSLILLGVSASSVAQQPYDVTVRQRNATDTGYIDRFLSLPAGDADGLFMLQGSSKLPVYTLIGSGLTVSSGVLSASAAAQVNSDWNAPSGVARILNKPTLATVAISGNYGDLTGAPDFVTASTLASGLATKYNVPTGTTSQYLRGDGSLATLPTVSAFNFSAPTAKTVNVSTAYQAADPSKAAIVTVSPSCQNATTLLASSACTLQVRQSASSGVTCSTGTVAMTWTSTVQLGLVFTQTSGSPFDVKLPAGGYFILCATSGTFTIAAVEQVAG